MSVLKSACRTAVEGFADSAPTMKREIYADSVAALLAFVAAFVILAFVGKLLWNNVVVDMISIAKPIRSFWSVIGLMLFLNLVRP